ncbi:MAG: LysR family transcriptional regulator [Sulfuricella sp.]|nr:LysR family transcriptional regulator [Sulfuricella sp.]
MDRLLAMQVFVSVVESGSFVRAAERMHLSTTAASRHVADLEQHVGARLLQRSTRRLSLTETGGLYFERCRQILADLDEADSLANEGAAQPKGKLRVSLPHSFGLRYVAPRIPEFCRRYPGLQLEVNFSDRIVDLVEGGIDVALRISDKLQNTLIARRLARIRMAVCAAPAYLAEMGAPRTPEDLREHRCLTYDYAPLSDTWHFLRHGEGVAVAVKSAFRSNSGDMTRLAALAGQGVVLQPTFLIGDDLRNGTLVRLLAAYELPEPAAYAVYPGGARRSARVKAFVEYFAEVFSGDPPPWDVGI